MLGEIADLYLLLFLFCTILHYSVLHPSDPSAGTKAGLAAPSSCCISMALAVTRGCRGWSSTVSAGNLNCAEVTCVVGRFDGIFPLSSRISLTWRSVISRKGSEHGPGHLG